MLRKGWEAIALFVVAMILVNIVIASVEPYMPVVGLVVVLFGILLVVRIWMKRRI